MKQAAAEDVAEVRRDDQFFAPDAPGRQDARTTIFKPGSGVTHAKTRKTRNIKVLLRTPAAAPAISAGTATGTGVFLCARGLVSAKRYS
jgi:hypothetical protein